MAEYFSQAAKEDPGVTWEALLLGWARQPEGASLKQAKILLLDLGLEYTMTVTRPLEIGVRFQVSFQSLVWWSKALEGSAVQGSSCLLWSVNRRLG